MLATNFFTNSDLSIPVKKNRWALLLALLLVTGAPAYAQTSPVQKDLYLDAIQSISRGQRQDANRVLRHMVQQEPENAGAWLDLAILQCKLGYAQEAERLFAEIEARFRPPPGIREIIAKQRTQGCAGWQPASRLSLMVGRGISDNVNQGASIPNFTVGTGVSRIELQLLPTYLPRSDQYTTMSGEYARDLTSAGTMGFVQFQGRINDTVSQFSTQSLAAGVEHPWHVGDWRIRGAGTLSALVLGGQFYQQQSRLQTQILPPQTLLRLPENFQFSLLTGVTHFVYPTLVHFDSSMMEMRGLLEYRTERTRLLTSIGYSYDVATAARPGGDRQGLVASAHAHTRIMNKVFGEVGWSRQTWTGASIYSPGLINQVRDQTTDILRAGLIIAVAQRHALHIELRQVMNHENISVFQYDSRLAQVSWQWLNF